MDQLTDKDRKELMEERQHLLEEIEQITHELFPPQVKSPTNGWDFLRSLIMWSGIVLVAMFVMIYSLEAKAGPREEYYANKCVKAWEHTLRTVNNTEPKIQRLVFWTDVQDLTNIYKRTHKQIDIGVVVKQPWGQFEHRTYSCYVNTKRNVVSTKGWNGSMSPYKF